jgi:hypothetical protein
MMPGILSLALLSAAMFEGGDDIALARRLAEVSGKPVALLYDPGRTWPRVARSEDEEQDETTRIVRSLRLDGTVGEGIGASDGAWPMVILQRSSREQWLSRVKPSETRPEIRRDAIWITADGPLPLGRAFPPGLRQPVTWHWFFQDAHVVVEAKGAEEAVYVQAIAGAIGARIEERGPALHLNFDPVIFRRRAVAGFERMAAAAPPGDELKTHYAFGGQAFAAASDEQLIWLFEERRRRLFLPVTAGSDLHKAAEARFVGMFGPGIGGQGKHHSTAAAGQHLAATVDWNSPPEIILDTMGQATTRWKKKDGTYAVF